MAQGDDLAYAELAYHWSAGNFFQPIYTIFSLRWFVYLPVAFFYKIFGINDVTSVLWPVSLSVLNVYLVFKIVYFETRQYLDSFLSALLYAVLPLISIYGMFLQVATCLEFSSLLTVFIFQRAVEKEDNRLFLLGGFAAGLIGLCRISGYLLLPLLFFYLIFKKGWKLKYLFSFLLFGAASFFLLFLQAVYYVVCLGDFFYHAHESARAVIQQNASTIDPKELWFYFRAYLPRGNLLANPDFGIYGPVFLVSFLSGLILRIRAVYLFGAWFFFLIFLHSFAPSSISPYKVLIRNTRYMVIFSAPLVAVIGVFAAEMFRRCQKRWAKGIVLAAFSGIVFISVWYLLQTSAAFKRNHQTYKDLSRFVLAQDKPIYIVEQDFIRLYKFYSQFKRTEFRMVKELEDIRAPGILALPLYHHPERYFMDYGEIKKLFDNPPGHWKLLWEEGNIKIFQVDTENAGIAIDVPTLNPVDLKKEHVFDMYEVLVLNQPMVGFEGEWLNHDHLFVGSVFPRGEILFSLASNRSFQGDLKIHFTTAPDFGMVNIFLNDELLEENVDLYSSQIGAMTASFSSIPIKQGINNLRFKINSKNAQSESFKMGIDSLELTEAIL